mmetsp:Transcript_11221/g.12315  ORF Transcript_11221/g.12315 Transcript_11221/m.12315 type:complete len:104 (+) Transcript_11221:63-374(+)
MASHLKNFAPTLNRVLVRLIETEAKTSSGILLNKNEDYGLNKTGIVVDAGPGKFTKKGAKIDNLFKVGDRVLLPEFMGAKIEMDSGDKYLMYRDIDILAHIEK